MKVELIDKMGTDLSVVNAARVSFGKMSQLEGGRLKDKDVRLIRYLAKHKHLSPFGHAFLSFHVKAPIFVARQLVKHEYLRWNEISRRYVDDPPEFYVPTQWRGRADDVKQGSGDSILDETTVGSTSHNTVCALFYQDLLDSGICPEQARIVLPQSTMTEWYWSGSLDAFANMAKLRLPKDTQYETRLIALQVADTAERTFPCSWEALLNEG